MTDSLYVLGDEDRRRFATIVANAWSDDSFARRYAAAPHEVLAAHGIEYPTSVPPPALPPRPEGDMNLEELAAAAASGGLGCASSVSSAYCISCVNTQGTCWGAEMESP